MFLINSRSHLVSEAVLRSPCAGFTQDSVPSPEVTALFCLVPSPEFSQRLGILYLSTCVGLQYGLILPMLSDFSWKPGINDFTTVVAPLVSQP